MDIKDKIVKEIKGELTPEEAKALSSYDDIGEIYDILISLKQNVEIQLASKKADLQEVHNECINEGPSGKQKYFAEKATYEKWKRGALRFKSGVEGKIFSLKRKLQKVRETHTLERVWGLLSRASELISKGSTGGEEWHADFLAERMRDPRDPS